MTSYAIGLYISGWLGDRVGLKSLLTIGLIASAFSYSSVAILEGLLNERSIYMDAIAFMINGFGQSTVNLSKVITFKGYPVCVAILSNWFSSNEKGLIFVC